MSTNLQTYPFLRAVIWTIATSVFAVFGECVIVPFFSLLNYAIPDSQLLQQLSDSSIDLFETDKMIHYTILILSALTVEYLMPIIFKISKIENKLTFTFGGFFLFILFFVSFFMETAHKIHEKCSINTPNYFCDCGYKSKVLFTIALLISLMIRYLTYKNEIGNQ